MLVVKQVRDRACALSNMAYLPGSPSFAPFNKPYVRIENDTGQIWCRAHYDMDRKHNTIGLSMKARAALHAKENSQVSVRPESEEAMNRLALPTNDVVVTFSSSKHTFLGHQREHIEKFLKDLIYMDPNLEYIIEIKGDPCFLQAHADGLIRVDEEASFTVVNKDGRILLGPRAHFSMEKIKKGELSVGGLDAHIDTLFTRVFMSHALPPAYLKRLGLTHAKGIILHGPPGCGKTLMARTIARSLLNVPEEHVKIVNAAELLNKYVGESEKNVRDLFAKTKEIPDQLNVIIFDEFDALAPRRTGGETNRVMNSVVNQLLSLIDGVDQLDNLVVIGLTNRLDLIDPAMLRPGRFEVHVYIGLPDRKAREEILEVHTRELVKGGFIDRSLLPQLAERTEGFSGAELESIVKETTFRALRSQISIDSLQDDIKKLVKEAKPIPLSMDLFETAISHYKETALPSLGDRPVRHLNLDFSRKNLVIIHGLKQTGKSASAIETMHQCGLTHVKRLCAEDVFGYSEYAKLDRLVELNKDEVGLIVLDDVEVLMNYAPVGISYSNALFQAIKTLCASKHHVILINKRLDVLQKFQFDTNATRIVDFDEGNE